METTVSEPCRAISTALLWPCTVALGLQVDVAPILPPCREEGLDTFRDVWAAGTTLPPLDRVYLGREVGDLCARLGCRRKAAFYTREAALRGSFCFRGCREGGAMPRPCECGCPPLLSL